MTASDTGAPAVTVVVLTYKRNDQLAVALPHLLAEARSTTPASGILVVDNDVDGGAAEFVRGYGADLVSYLHVPAPGIAHARNAALREVTTRFLAFIDDDMHPEPGWLTALLRTQDATGAVLVAGPVLEHFDVEPDDYIQAGRFFRRRRLPTGSVLDVVASGNLLMDLPVVRATGVEFDVEFGLRGGSDYLFARALGRRGCLMVWSDEAITHDRVPATRSTREWVLRRAYRVGDSQILAALALSDSAGERVRIRVDAVVGGCARMAVGALRALYGRLARSVAHRARGERAVCRGAGMIAGAAGHAYSEYARPAAETGAGT